MDGKLFVELLERVDEMEKIHRSKKRFSKRSTVLELEVRDVGKQAWLWQAHFARLIRVSKRTLENWEQGRSSPTRSTRALLTIASKDPKGAGHALHGCSGAINPATVLAPGQSSSVAASTGRDCKVP